MTYFIQSHSNNSNNGTEALITHHFTCPSFTESTIIASKIEGTQSPLPHSVSDMWWAMRPELFRPSENSVSYSKYVQFWETQNIDIISVAAFTQRGASMLTKYIHWVLRMVNNLYFQFWEQSLQKNDKWYLSTNENLLFDY